MAFIEVRSSTNKIKLLSGFKTDKNDRGKLVNPKTDKLSNSNSRSKRIGEK